MKRHFSFFGLLCAVSIIVQAQAPPPPDCTSYDFSWAGTTQTPNDTTGHASLSHYGYGYIYGTCSYSGAYISGYCTNQCLSTAYNDVGEAGDLTNILLEHEVNYQQTGAETGTGGGWITPPTVQCGGQLAWGATSCFALVGCNLSITISGTNPQGVGGSVTFTTTGTTIWANQNYSYLETCPAHLSPGCVSGAYPTGGGDGAAGLWVWNSSSCQWVWQKLGNTPIIIDTDGSGFHLTSAAGGVLFDFYGDGKPIQIAWTAQGSTNGWLAIDLNGNGTIDSAKELFSNVAEQPANPSDPNAPDGFNDLAQYDANHDGVIDSQDPVWPRPLVWIDSNHDGISQPGELHTLDSLGIHSISTSYTLSPKTDAFGNQFHLKGRLNPDKGDNVDRVIYDVYLTSVHDQPATAATTSDVTTGSHSFASLLANSGSR